MNAPVPGSDRYVPGPRLHSLRPHVLLEASADGARGTSEGLAAGARLTERDGTDRPSPRRDDPSDPAADVVVPVVSAVVPGSTTVDPFRSFEAFYQADRVRLGRALTFAIGDVDLAADATDEAFARAYERWSSVSQGNPPAWVYRVALNWARSALRRRRRGHDRFYDPADTAMGMVEPAVHAALAELDPKHRAVVVCRHLLGWSVADTAAALHVREGTVKSRLSRANQILQARLRHLSPTEELS